jgi:serine/threonine protein kinase
VVKDVESLKKFRSTLDSSDYAASLVDKAISAYKNKATSSSNAAVDQFSDPFEELVILSKENNAKEGDEDDDDDENSVEQAIDLMKLLAQLDPHDRITADDAIKHPYVSKVAIFFH